MKALDFDKPDLPVLKVVKGGKTYEIYPVALLCGIGENLPKRKRGGVTELEAVNAIRKASGIAKLTPDEAFRLRQAAQELLLRSEVAKKKLLQALGSSGSTPASAGSPESQD